MTSSTVPNADRPSRRIRTALFVDFDNVYIGLLRLDPQAAEAFATDPAQWLAALETGTDGEGDFTRRFLIRACYLNPSVFAQFRPNFTRAGFQVVDCPSLTQQGKSSADINLVLDAVDALAAPTHYEEFVIVSADADFTPLALRCRAADRRVTIITASPAASAYRSVADAVVTADDLAELLTGAADRAEEPAADAPAPTPAKDRDADALQRQVVAVTDTPGLSQANYRVLLTTLADDVQQHRFDRVETTRRVWNACQESGAAVGRSTVNTVVSGILYTGLQLTPSTSARDLAAAWADNVVGLCRGARMDLSPGDEAAIRAWVGGGLLDA